MVERVSSEILSIFHRQMLCVRITFSLFCFLLSFNDNLPGFPRLPCKYIPCSVSYSRAIVQFVQFLIIVCLTLHSSMYATSTASLHGNRTTWNTCRSNQVDPRALWHWNVRTSREYSTSINCHAEISPKVRFLSTAYLNPIVLFHSLDFVPWVATG